MSMYFEKIYLVCEVVEKDSQVTNKPILSFSKFSEAEDFVTCMATHGPTVKEEEDVMNSKIAPLFKEMYRVLDKFKLERKSKSKDHTECVLELRAELMDDDGPLKSEYLSIQNEVHILTSNFRSKNWWLPFYNTFKGRLQILEIELRTSRRTYE